MAKMRLLNVACTVAMLAAAPAFAQSNTETGSTGAGGTAVNPTAHEAMSGSSDSMSGGRSHAGMGHSMHRHMGHNAVGMHDRTSQDMSADQLNEKSYQAARTGQPFSSGGTMAPGGSGGMNDMSGGSMSGGSMSGGGATSNSGSGSNGAK